jgi:ribosomal protein L40E
VLRALKDLELEHSMGKIDDDDYRELSARYRETAKTLMRAMDADLAPRRERAVALVDAYLEKRGLDGEAPALEDGKDHDEAPESTSEDADRMPCAGCGTTNDLDASFCKKCGSLLAAPVATEKVNATT